MVMPNAPVQKKGKKQTPFWASGSGGKSEGERERGRKKEIERRDDVCRDKREWETFWRNVRPVTKSTLSSFIYFFGEKKFGKWNRFRQEVFMYVSAHFPSVGDIVLIAVNVLRNVFALTDNYFCACCLRSNTRIAQKHISS